MNKREIAQLQRLINASVKAQNAAHKADREIAAFELKYWGFDHGECPRADEIIDNVFGGCGRSTGMTAEAYIEVMDEGRG